MTQATPRPWTIVNQHIEGRDGRTVQTEIDCPFDPPEDMKFIVRAANSFDDLLAALKAAVRLHGLAHDTAWIEQARAAIKKAEEVEGGRS